MQEFRAQLKTDLKASKVRHFSSGPKHSNSLLTRLRVGRSDLNLHKFSIGLTGKPECICHAKSESTKHHVLDWCLYVTEHQTLFGLVERHIPYFTWMNNTEKPRLLLNGLKTDHPVYNHLNLIISKAV